jgi:hypothetical protein
MAPISLLGPIAGRERDPLPGDLASRVLRAPAFGRHGGVTTQARDPERGVELVAHVNSCVFPDITANINSLSWQKSLQECVHFHSPGAGQLWWRWQGQTLRRDLSPGARSGTNSSQSNMASILLSMCTLLSYSSRGSPVGEGLRRLRHLSFPPLHAECSAPR